MRQLLQLHVLTLPVYDPPVVYLDVNIAGSLSYVMDGSVQFRIFVVSDESKNWDSLNVQLPQENVKDAEGPAHHMQLRLRVRSVRYSKPCEHRLRAVLADIALH